MSGLVFIAVLTAAALHATWNAIVKGGADQFTSMGAVVLGHMPLALVAVVVSPLPTLASLPYLFAGIALHVGYQMFLMYSYRAGDLTQVYPIARGSAPLLVALFSVFALGVVLSGAEILAVAIIGAGILSLAVVRRVDGARNGQAAMLALTTGCFIAAYSLVDGLGARVAATPLGFFGWLSLGNSVVFVAILTGRAPGVLRDIATRGRRVFLIGGSASFIAYSLVVWAFTQAPIALVTAMRESSIVIALIIGVVLMKERLDLARLASTMAVLLGVVLLRLSRQ